MNTPAEISVRDWSGCRDPERGVFSVAFGNCPDAVAVTAGGSGSSAKIVYANPAFRLIATNPDGEHLGESVSAALNLDARSSGWELLDQAVAQGRTGRAICTRIRPDCSTESLEVTVFPVANGDGRSGFAWSFRLQSTLSAEADLLATTNQMANVGGWEYDVGTDSLRWTEQTFHIHDLPPGRQPTVAEGLAFYHPDDRGRVQEALRQVLEGGPPYKGDFRLVTAKGRTIWTRSTCRVVMDTQGKVIRLVGAFQDITEQKLAESLIVSQTAWMAAIGDNLPCGAIYQYRQWHDGRRAMTYCSAGVESLCGLPAHKIVENVDLLFALIDPAQLEALAHSIATSMQTLTVFETELRVLLVDGTARWLHLRSTPRWAGGEYVEWDGVMLDVTARKVAETQAEEAQDRYRRLLHSLDVIIWEARPGSTQFTFVSQQAEAILGYPLAEWTDSPTFWADHIHPDDRDRTIAECQDKCGQGLNHDLQYRMIAADGRIVWVYDRVQLAEGPDGQIRMFGVIQDMTEAVRIHENLAAREAQFRTLANNMPEGLVVVDPHDAEVPLRILYANPKLASNAGYTPDELIGKSITMLDSPEAGSRAVERSELALAGELLEFEVEHRHKDGHLVPMEVRAIRIGWEGREALLGINRDITERRRAEADIRRANERFRLAAAAAGLGVWDYFPQEDRLAWDDQMFRLYGANRDEFRGKLADWRVRVHPDHLAATEDELGRAILSEVALDVQLRIVWPNREVRHLRGTATTTREGEIVRVTGVNYDVTDAVRAEEHRRQMEARLQQSQKLEAIGQLAGGVAHDFNNLLTVVNGCTQMLLATLPGHDPNRETLSAIATAGEKGAALTKQLLAFGRKQIVRSGPVDLNDNIRIMHGLFPRLLSEKIRCEFLLSPEPVVVQGDSDQLDQVLMNLAVNARDAMPRGGRLQIHTDLLTLADDSAEYPEAQPGRYVRLVVADTGCGMDEQIKSRIFEPFFTTKGVGQGSGLGLATVYGIVKSFGGHIAVESELGVGSTFRLIFPESPVAFTRLAQTATPTIRGSEWILHVEDDDNVRRLTKILLEKAGYRVTDVTNGEDAVAEFDRDPSRFQLLLTDIVMPGLNGRELAEVLTRKRPDLPVVYVSGYTDDLDFRQGVERDTVRFLHKPFTAATLQRIIRAALDNLVS